MNTNPLFNLLGLNPQNGSPFGNLMGLMTQFNNFKSSFQGDPHKQVQELLNSGQMTQAQFDQLSQAAQAFQQLMKG